MKTKYASISRLIGLLSLAAVAAGSPVHASSLWTDGGHSREASMVSDRRATQVGDILTVIVSESASVKASNRTKTDKTSGVDASVDQFLFPSSRLGTHNGELPGTKLSGSTDFSGGGEIANSQSVTARAAVTVVDVLPNGNLVIEGSRYVSYSGEQQYAILRGIVRPDDIQPGNTVLSSAIADARVEFLSKGAISAAQRKGWFTRIIDTINPF